MVVRSQLQSIADETIDQAKLDPKGRVAVFVEGEGPRPLVENAFIEALQKRNYISVVHTNVAIEQTFQVFILDCDIKIREIDSKKMERTVRTALEVRTVKGSEHETRSLGIFRQEAKDTAQTFSEVHLPTTSLNNDGGVFQRLITPFIVIGGAVLMIYLFFTVRS